MKKISIFILSILLISLFTACNKEEVISGDIGELNFKLEDLLKNEISKDIESPKVILDRLEQEAFKEINSNLDLYFKALGKNNSVLIHDEQSEIGKVNIVEKNDDGFYFLVRNNLETKDSMIYNLEFKSEKNIENINFLQNIMALTLIENNTLSKDEITSVLNDLYFVINNPTEVLPPKEYGSNSIIISNQPDENNIHIRLNIINTNLYNEIIASYNQQESDDISNVDDIMSEKPEDA